MSKYESIGKGVVRRRQRRVLGLFIDGVGLDRAARRLNRKVDLAALVRGVSSGIAPVVARYYTIIPYEDDARQHAFLDAVARAGLKVIVKRLPPKGITRQVTADVEMAADIVAFGLGHDTFSNLSEYRGHEDPEADRPRTAVPILPGARGASFASGSNVQLEAPQPTEEQPSEGNTPEAPAGDLIRAVTLVCPSRELSYPVSLLKELGVDTTNADFGKFTGSEIMKAAAKWIDLSDSETIWRD